MRIGVDACCWANKRGFGRFTRELLSALITIDQRNEYFLFVALPDGHTLFHLPKSLKLPIGEHFCGILMGDHVVDRQNDFGTVEDREIRIHSREKEYIDIVFQDLPRHRPDVTQAATPFSGGCLDSKPSKVMPMSNSSWSAITRRTPSIQITSLERPRSET